MQMRPKSAPGSPVQCPGIRTDQESSFQDPRIQAAWVTQLACFCPTSQQSRETLPTPQRRPEAGKGPKRCLKVTSTGLVLGRLPRKSPKAVLFKMCFPAKGASGILWRRQGKKRKLGGWDSTSSTPAHFNLRPWGTLGGNHLLIGYFPCQEDPKESPVVKE